MGKVLAKVTTSTLAGSKSSRVCIPVSQMIPWSQHLEALLFGSLSIEKAAGMLRLCVVWAALLCWHPPFEVQMGPREVSMQPSGLDADFPE